MKSQWFEYKDKAIELRKQGLSYGEIQNLLSIPRSTLSHWLRHVELTSEQKIRLEQNYGNGLIKARVKASQWHKAQKELRLQKAREDAEQTFNDINLNDNIIELTLAMLYLGEGTKNKVTAIGNSDPLILRFFIAVLIRQYGVDLSKIKCELHLRADQNAEEMKQHWSKELDLPPSNFRTIVFDKRTVGRVTYPNYKGVCIVHAGNVAIQRKLINLYNLFCQKVIDDFRAVSSTG